MNFPGIEMLKAVLAASVVGLALAGCSAGGPECGQNGTTCKNSGGTTPVVTTPTIAVTLSSATVTTGAPATVTATLTNGSGSPIAGIQSWIALPAAHEESDAFFVHHDESTLPLIEEGGKRVRVTTGTETFTGITAGLTPEGLLRVV